MSSYVFKVLYYSLCFRCVCVSLLICCVVSQFVSYICHCLFDFIFSFCSCLSLSLSLFVCVVVRFVKFVRFVCLPFFLFLLSVSSVPPFVCSYLWRRVDSFLCSKLFLRFVFLLIFLVYVYASFLCYIYVFFFHLSSFFRVSYVLFLLLIHRLAFLMPDQGLKDSHY